jgi:hypothetical protein
MNEVKVGSYAAEQDGGKKRTVTITRLAGQQGEGVISVNGRPSRFRMNKPITVTESEYEALTNVGAVMSETPATGAGAS